VFIVSLLAVLMSLYFSDVLGYAPCVLCWYQRILMYPLVLISVVAIIFKDQKVYRYILPLSLIGTLVALFHNLLYWKIIPESAAPCLNGISCTAKYLQLAGFVTIPFLSLVAFILITVLTLIYRQYENK
jgi:disulfide bond formation protein DsbB